MQPYPQTYQQPAPAQPLQMGNPNGTVTLTMHDPSLGGGPGPSPDELVGACVLFIPKSIDENSPIPDRFLTRDAANQVVGPTTKAEITADIVVISAATQGNYYFGAAPKANPPRRQPTHVTALPAFFPRRQYNQTNIVTALRPFIGTGAVVGIVFESDKGTKGSPPKSIQTLDDNDPRRVIANQLLTAYAQGGMTLKPPLVNEPAEMTPAPQMPANPYAAAAPAPVPQYVPQNAYGQPAPPYAQSVPAAPQPSQDPAYAAWLASQQQAAAPVVEQGPPPGFEVIWPKLGDAEKTAVLAQQAAPHPLG